MATIEEETSQSFVRFLDDEGLESLLIAEAWDGDIDGGALLNLWPP